MGVVQQQTSSKSSSDISDEDAARQKQLEKWARELKQGVKIKDRKWRTHRQCFLHKDAVQWMKARTSNDEERAVAVLNELRKVGMIQHVVDPSKPFQVGRSKTTYFCFLDDSDSDSHVSLQKESAAKVNNVSIPQAEWNSLQIKLQRMEASVAKLSDTQTATQTKLEIVHLASTSLIQAMVLTALLLVLLLIYTLLAIVPSLHDSNGIMIGTAAVGIVLTVAFLSHGWMLYSIWTSLDTFMEGSGEGEGEEEAAAAAGSDGNAPLRRSRPGIGRRTSVVMRESLFQRPSQLVMPTNMKSFLSQEYTSKQILQRPASDLPHVSEWPHRPVLACNNTPVSKRLVVEQPYGNGPCPIGKPFSFSSELFEGTCLIRLKNIPNSDDVAGDDAYFSGRRRLFQTIVQGRFKEPLSLNEVMTGHEFVKPLQNLPHPWILKAATNLIGKLAPGATIQVLGNQPTMLAPLAATSQVVRGDEPGNEPDIASENDIQEDCSSLGGKFLDGTISSATSRKLHLASPKRAQQYFFDTETIYTFDFYQSLLNCATYSLDLGLANVGMAKVLNGQPIQCLAKTTDGRYLWSFQIWHEDLLPRSNKEDSPDMMTMTSTETSSLIR
jgi:hypothetical protein